MSHDVARHDQVVHFWCPQLGQTMTFAYCRRAAKGLPCACVIQCFSPHFAVEEFLARHYGDQERARFLGPQPGRLERMAKALEQAQCGEPEGQS